MNGRCEPSRRCAKGTRSQVASFVCDDVDVPPGSAGSPGIASDSWRPSGKDKERLCAVGVYIWGSGSVLLEVNKEEGCSATEGESETCAYSSTDPTTGTNQPYDYESRYCIACWTSIDSEREEDTRTHTQTYDDTRPRWQ